MKKLFVRVSVFILRILLRIRYKIEYKGLKELILSKDTTTNGTLFLPNHPAVVVDPLIAALPILEPFKARPLVVEYMYYEPLFRPFVEAIDALPVPNLSTGASSLKIRRTEKLLEEMSKKLKDGNSFIIYPSGTTKHTGKEVLGGAFGAYKLISENPQAKVVLIRMTGLWGSSFSRAFTAGEAPKVSALLSLTIKTIMKNLIFFVPKRRVVVEFFDATKVLPKNATRQRFNQFLENWYNEPFNGKEEPLSLVSYSRWKQEIPQIQPKIEEQFVHSIPKDVQDTIIEKVAEIAKRDKSTITPAQHLIAELGLDSLSLAELVTFLEEEYGVKNIAPSDLKDVQRLFLIAMKHYEKEPPQEPKWNLKKWDQKRAHIPISLPKGETLIECFIRSSKKNRGKIACADPKSGPVTYKALLQGVFALEKAIALLPGERIGIFLPSSIACQVATLACHLAGKTPVMINWTVGRSHLETVVNVAKIEKVLTSWQFLDMLEGVDITPIENMLVLLEEIKRTMSLFDKVHVAYKSLLPIKNLLKHCPKNGDKEAVILFTSGTEGMPKGVPLTHRNILENQRWALKSLKLFEDDILLSILPSFHSFGFSITGLLPFVAGLRAVYYPNPTEGMRLAKAIRKWRVTILCAAPTFLKIIFSSSKIAMPNVRMIISGAEKAPKDLLTLANICPNAEFVEGYGITECSPVVTINHTATQGHGVGYPLSNLSIVIVDPENYTKKKNIKEQGLILVRGSSVFKGYLNMSKNSPFIEHDAQLWYNTGDLGYLDERNALHLSGRLKRFAKIGGEMVNLQTMEETLQTAIASKTEENSVRFVVIAREDDQTHRPKLILCTTEMVTVQDVNGYLKQAGLGNLARIDEIIHVDEIPVQATGKVSLRVVEELIAKQKNIRTINA